MVRNSQTKTPALKAGVLVWYGYLEGGFERRLLARVRGTLATNPAFPQKSESVPSLLDACMMDSNDRTKYLRAGFADCSAEPAPFLI